MTTPEPNPEGKIPGARHTKAESAAPNDSGPKKRVLTPSDFYRGSLADGFYRLNSELLSPANVQLAKRIIYAARDMARYELDHPSEGNQGSKVLADLGDTVLGACEPLILEGDLNIAGRFASWKRKIDVFHRKYKDVVERGVEERRLITRFAGHLQAGFLWNDGLHLIDFGLDEASLPSKSDAATWTTLAMGYLRCRFGEEPWRLIVFLPMLARNRASASGKNRHKAPTEAITLLEMYDEKAVLPLQTAETTGRGWKLLNASPSEQWKAIHKQLSRAFSRLASGHRRQVKSVLGTELKNLSPIPSVEVSVKTLHSAEGSPLIIAEVLNSKNASAGPTDHSGRN